MRRRRASAILGVVLLLAGGSHTSRTLAQPSEEAQGAEFVRLYERLQTTLEPEEKIALAERAIALEAALTRWPLGEAREFVKGELASRAAFAYMARRQGERADNLERAVALYEAALQARTRQSFPLDWSNNQVSLAIAYRERLRGNPADNQEKAIACLEAALAVATRDASPQIWARAQTGLGSAYRLRIRGVRADNLEEAIAYHEAALTVFTREAFPQDWAKI